MRRGKRALNALLNEPCILDWIWFAFTRKFLTMSAKEYFERNFEEKWGEKKSKQILDFDDTSAPKD